MKTRTDDIQNINWVTSGKIESFEPAKKFISNNKFSKRKTKYHPHSNALSN